MTDLPPELDVDALIAALSDKERTNGYANGVLDALGVLGLSEPDDELADLIVSSLLAHLRDGVTAQFDKLNLLKQIEHARLSVSDPPTPARVVSVVQAVVKTRPSDEDRYLMQFDAGAGRFQPIGGKVDPDDRGPEDALRREFAEELFLDQPLGSDILQVEGIGEILCTTQISATYGILTQYTFHFFHVLTANFDLTPDNDTLWISRTEMESGQTSDERPISPILIEGLGWPLLDSLAPLA